VRDQNLGLVMAYPEWRRSCTRRVRCHPRSAQAHLRRHGREKAAGTRVVADDQVAAGRTQPREHRRGRRSSRWHKRFARRLADPLRVTAAEHDGASYRFGTEDFRIGYAAFLAKRKPGSSDADVADAKGHQRTQGLAGMHACSSSLQIVTRTTCGMMLADMGADVVKVEKLPRWDDARSYRTADQASQRRSDAQSQQARDRRLSKLLSARPRDPARGNNAMC
jgi:hypothetical protein